MNKYKAQRRRFKPGTRCTLDDTSMSSRPDELPGIPGVVVKAPYTEKGDTYVHIAIESEVMHPEKDDVYIRKIFEVRVPIERVTPV